MINRRAFLGGVACAPLLGFVPPAFGIDPAFQIGIADLVLQGQMKPEVAHVVVQAMSALFEVPGKPKPDFQFGASATLATRLKKKEIHLAIMTGIEYGWIGTAFPDLVPLVTAYTSDIRLKACILVTNDSNKKEIKDLRGTSLTLPKRLQHYPLLYLQQEILEEKSEPKKFFDQILVSADTDDAIESVVENKTTAVLVDVDSWKAYQERKPGRAKRLKVIDESEPFPTSAVLYHPSTWGADDLKVLKNVLCTAHERPFTRQILNFWRITKFVAYSAEYQSVVNKILDEIPKPMVPFSPQE